MQKVALSKVQKNKTTLEKFQNSATKKVPFEYSVKKFENQNMVPLNRYRLGKPWSFATKKVLLEKSMKNHKQNWYHYSEEPKFSIKSGPI